MKLLEQSQIPPLPHESLPQNSTLPLTFFDLIWFDYPPIHRCFFYRLPRPTIEFLESDLPRLKSSLSATLLHFYPLAGKARPSPASDELFELHYALGDSVSVSVYEYESDDDDDFLDLAGHGPHHCSRLGNLVPATLAESDRGKSLLAVQLTVFPSRGVVVGFAINHVACDGFSSTHFIKSWAAAAAAAAVGIDPQLPRPSLDRTAVTSDFLRKLYLRVLNMKHPTRPQQTGSVSALIERSPERTNLLKVLVFELRPEHINQLKVLVRSTSPFHCSTYVVSTAYLWACFAKLRRYDADQTIYFPLIVDWRQRLRPSAPATYFGNCVCSLIVEMKARDISKADGVLLASEAIGSAIEGLRDGNSRLLEETVEKWPRVMASNAVFMVGASPNFKVYDADFGWGRPVKVQRVMEHEGVTLAEGRDRGRGVEVGVALSSWSDMEEFTAIFNEGLKQLDNQH